MKKGVAARDLNRVLPIDKDDGCEYSPSCLKCPLPACRYDSPGIAARLVRQDRDAAIRKEYNTNLYTIGQLSKTFKVAPRTVSRAVEKISELSPPMANSDS